ncbi:MAG: exodeoxyribonuclease VII large subunit [Candidatus Eremiobacteraeota bacterium]|nr:exodeoxyribonuclease VII large subunit [Candidatus Eremiobacteraeota bacterium]
MDIFTVQEITSYLKDVLESDDVLADLSVSGEISNFSESLAGHCYFTLKDPHAQLRCVFFKGARARIRLPLREGMKIVARGRISVYEKQGQYQLIVEHAKKEGQGELYEQFLKLRKKLEDEGLFDEARKSAIPPHAVTVGVVTSPYGAALRDIVTTLKKRSSVTIVLSPALVQGADAPGSLIAALKRLEKVPSIDLIIIGRGGGSFEELNAFNDEALARAVYACPVPVISAVGHETDFTICDMVADHRAPTPTAAAVAAVPDSRELSLRMKSLMKTLGRSLDKTLKGSRIRLKSLQLRLEGRHPKRHLERLAQNLDMLYARGTRALTSMLTLRKSRLLAGREILEAYNPRHVIERGYCIAYKMPREELVKKTSQVAPEDKVRLVVGDGSILARVMEARKDQAGKAGGLS